MPCKLSYEKNAFYVSICIFDTLALYKHEVGGVGRNMSLADEAEHEQLMRRQHTLNLDKLKYDYLDRRVHKNIEQERKNIESNYTLSIREIDDMHREETRKIEGKEAGIRDDFQKHPRYRYRVDDMVLSTMKNLLHTADYEHHKAKLILDNGRAQMLRALDEGIDPHLNSEYERIKHSTEWNEKVRLSEIQLSSQRRKQMKYDEEASARRKQYPQNNPPWEMGASHRSRY